MANRKKNKDSKAVHSDEPLHIIENTELTKKSDAFPVSVSSFSDAGDNIKVRFLRDFSGNFNNKKFNQKEEDVIVVTYAQFDYLKLFRAVIEC